MKKVVRPIEDYGNPMLWVVTLGAFIIAIVLLPILISLLPKSSGTGFLLSGVGGATLAGLLWLTLWSLYKKSCHFKKRYGS